MRRDPYDLFAKDCLELLLEDAGRMQRAHEVALPAQVIDAAFTPSARGAAMLRRRGLLGRLARERCAWECFHDAPSVDDLRDLARKHLAWHQLLTLRARRRDRRATVPLPPLYVVCAARPTRAMGQLAATSLRRRGGGFYAVSRGLVGMCLIVVAELPMTRATLPLRLMGRGAVLDAALAEVAALPRGRWEHRIRKAVVQFRKRLDSDERSGEMGRLAEQIKAYEKKLMELGIRKGRTEGRTEGRMESLVPGVELRLGRTLTRKERAAVREKVTTLGVARFTRAVLARTPEALAAWLAAAAVEGAAAK